MGTSLFYLILAMGTIFMRMLVNLLLSCAIGTIFMPMLANLLLSCARNNIYAYVGEPIIILSVNIFILMLVNILFCLMLTIV